MSLMAAAWLGPSLILLVTVNCVCCADDSSLREAFTDAVYFKDEALRAFKLGVLSLEERAEVCECA